MKPVALVAVQDQGKLLYVPMVPRPSIFARLFVILAPLFLTACGDGIDAGKSERSAENREMTRQERNLAKDLAAIEQLHRTDVAASSRQDFETLRGLLTEDIVAMPPGSPPISGTALLGNDQTASQIEVTKYEMEFEEVVVLGDYAHEWGRIDGAAKTLSDGVMHKYSYNFMRILKKGADGQWRVHRTIWNQINDE